MKYHENLNDDADDHRSRYDDVAEAMGCFAAESRQRLQQKPLQQIWRDHLLAGAYRMADGFSDGLFAYISPAGNSACADAVNSYVGCLTNRRTFESWSLESLVDAILAHTDANWVRDFADRYLVQGVAGANYTTRAQLVIKSLFWMNFRQAA